MSRVDLSRNDITNILQALNAIQVRGKDQMIVVMTLIAKLERALAADVAEDSLKDIATVPPGPGE